MKSWMIIVAATLAFVVACGSSGKQTDALAQGEPVTQEAAKKIYNRKCGLCHGKDGKKMLAGASDLSKSKMNLEKRVAIITYGKGKMTPFQNTLTPQEIEAVAEYTAMLVEE